MRIYLFSCTLVLCLIIILLFYSISPDLKNVKTTQFLVFRNYTEESYTGKVIDLKYILLWTFESNVNVPLVYMGEGQKGFLTRNCSYVNCFVTADKKLLKSHSKFDVIVFPGPELDTMLFSGDNFPNTRSLHQKYVFASIEAAATYPVSSSLFDGYFNWTWTYKLDSNLKWGYIVVRDLNNNIIGPKIDMHWLKLEEMEPTKEKFKLKLKSKKRAVAWFVSNCQSESRREIFVNDLKNELLKYKHLVDIYGDCGLNICTRAHEKDCDEKIAKYYYFYLSFENAFSEDYVTEKLLRALKNDAIPVVYGGANYTRFMPDGIYLNALDLGVKKLAAKMDELIKNPEKYANYFRWKNHYKYEKTTESMDTNEYCRMCAVLNDKDAVAKTTVYENFRQWWNPIPPDADFFLKKLKNGLLGKHDLS